MLTDVAKDVKEHYYDPHFHGVDFDAKVREAGEKIDKAESLNRALTAIASALDNLNDSHTSFMPPSRPYVNDYGFEMQMIGDRCYIVRVRPGSDAETKGLNPGDQVLTLNGYTPTRDDFRRMQYVFWILRPQQRLYLKLRTATGEERQVEISAKFTLHSKIVDLYEKNFFDIRRDIADQERRFGVRYANRDYDLLIVRLPVFYPFKADAADSIVSKTQGYKAVIFDLRGDPGGEEEMCQSLLGGIFKE